MKGVITGRVKEFLGKSPIRPLYHYILDNLDLLSGKRGPLIPPARMVLFVGHAEGDRDRIYEDFSRVGRNFVKHFVELGGLRPDGHVLDVGCGIGRMAIPLTTYLKDGSYEGLDIVPSGIEWCRRKITPRYPNFHFQLADVCNEHYNPSGKYRASEYRFPFDDEMFDFVYLTSVFTHLLPPDLENYLSQIARVLRKGGRCFITYFLLNDESLKLMRENYGRPNAKKFEHGLEKFEHGSEEFKGKCLWMSQKDPEAAIAYYEAFVRNLYRQYGLAIVEPPHYGSWCGRSDHLSYQDIIVAVKTTA